VRMNAALEGGGHEHEKITNMRDSSTPSSTHLKELSFGKLSNWNYENSYLVRIPQELFVEIIYHLNPVDVINLSFCCCEFHVRVTSDRVWNSVYLALKVLWQQKLDVCKKGYLMRESGLLKSWKNQWFVLHNTGNLLCHTSQNGRLIEKIPLKYCGDISYIDYKKKKNCFEVQTLKKAWRFIASTSNDREEWVQELHRVRDFWLGINEDMQLSVKDLYSMDEFPGTIKEDSFEKLKMLGRGTFGKVFQVRKKATGEIYAMKILRKSVAEGKEIPTQDEKRVLKKLNNPFLVHLHHLFQTSSLLYFVMDYVDGGELFYHLYKQKKWKEKIARFYGAEILEGVSYLQKMGIIYCYLKPENILLASSGHICMTDFGIAKRFSFQRDDSPVCFSVEYYAPEVLRGKRYGKEANWWCFGIILYEMITGLPPFYSEDVQKTYENILTGKIDWPEKMSPQAKSLLSMLLQVNPTERLTDPEIIRQHEFFVDIDWEKLAKQELEPPIIPELTNELISPEFLIDPGDAFVEFEYHFGDFT